MGKIIKITEAQLKRIVDNHINEQTATLTPSPQQPITSLTTSVQSGTQQNTTSNNTLLSSVKKKYPCVPEDFALSYSFLIEQKKYNKQFVRAALSIIGRESSFASGKRYNILNVLKRLGTTVGIDTSIGPAQMKTSTAKEFGVDPTTNTGALDAAYRYLVKYYNLAIKNGYDPNKPSTMGNEGTGNGALDIAIASYNAGFKIIEPWCKTSDPNVCKRCSEITSGAKIVVPNYIPNYKTERIDSVNTSTKGYVKEVAGYYKKFTC